MINAKEKLAQLSPQKRALLLARLTKSARGNAGKTKDSASNGQSIAPSCEPFPLTPLQEAYWLGRSSDFEMGNLACHSYFEFDSAGIDLERLERAWQKLIARHEMLRAVILPDAQQQILRQTSEYEIKTADLRTTDAAAVDAQLARIREELSHQVLASDKWPLFEVRAARLDEARVRLFVSVDGLIADASSVVVLFREWSQLYDNPEVELPPIGFSFRDYVLAEKSQENSEEFRRAREYWRERIPLLPPAPDLPQAIAAHSISNPRFTRRTERLEPAAWSRLKTRAAQAGLKPSTVLLAAYAEALSLWSRSPHFTLNVPSFHRPAIHPDVDKIVGEFASFTLLEVDNSKPGSFAERSRRWQNQLERDFNHRQFSGVQALREIARIQNRSGALMPIVFTDLTDCSRETNDNPSADPKVPGQLIFAINQTPQVWLDNHLTECAGALECDWDTVDQAFPEGLPEAMLGAFVRLLRLLAEDEQTWEASAAENARRLIPSRDLERRANLYAEAPIPELLAQQLFERQAVARPTHPALVAVNRTFTYEELDRVSNQIAWRLRELQVKPNSLVAVVMEKGWEQVVAALAIVKSGAAYLPVDPDVPSERLEYLLRHSEVRIALTQSTTSARITWPAQILTIVVDREDWSAGNPRSLPPVQTPDDLLYVLYTSGSTGLPKGVMIAHRGVVNCIVQTNATFQIGPGDRVLALTALHHDMSVFDIFSVLAAGGTIVMPLASGRRDPAHWSELMLRHEVTLWNSVPAMMEMMLEYAAERSGILPRSLRLAFLGGDWIQVTLPNRLRAVAENAQVVSVGGPTETTLWNIWYPVTQVDPNWKSIPYGRPIANTKYHVLNEALEHCPTWVAGELCCAGVGLAKGYWRDEEKTRSKFLANPATGERIYRTGDWGRYLPDGNIEFVGRVDFQVKIQGQRIELGEIESALQQHHAVRAAVVAAVGDAKGKQRLVGYVVLNGGCANVVNAELRAHLLKKLPEHMVPSAFVTLPELPLSANGKVNRLALPAPSDQNAEPGKNTSAQPGQTLISSISELVKKVLEIEALDPDASLMSYGANSIDMVRIGNQLEKQFGFRPRMDQLFRLQTVAALAQYYDQHRKQTGVRAETINAPSEPDTKALLASYRVMIDPAEREAFKKSQPGLRRDDENKQSIPLMRPMTDETLMGRYRERRSHRKFSSKPIPFSQFGNFLSCLRQINLDGKPKYRYASPGGLYPGQVYLHVKRGRVEGVRAGTYYYHPIEHRLIELTPDVELDRTIHVPFVNTPIFDEAAFSVFQVAALRAITPSYGDRSIHFATLEAGVMAHLLEISARAFGLGLCQIGSLEFERIRPFFLLENDHVLVHSLLGGLVAEDGSNREEIEPTTADRATAILERIKELSQEEIRTLLEKNKRMN